MERITSHQVVDLMEAYNTVHAPQITEEQIQEDFENWVNSLVEEGHDLSEYTWDEMYEEYLNEYAAGGVPGPGGAVTMYSRPRANTGQPYQSRFARPMNAGTPQRTGRATAVSRPQVGGLPSSARQVTQYPQGVSTGVGGGNAAASRQAPAARPATPAPTAARPATPTPAPSAATTGFQLAQQGVNLAQPKKPSLASQAAELRAMQAASRQRQGLTQSFDVFDVVKGYLLDEGYADTEEAALQIMANMSEEWREEIIDEELTGERLSRAAKKDGRDARAKKDRTMLHRVIGQPNQDQTSFGKGNKATRRQGYSVRDTSNDPYQDERRSEHNRNRGVKNKKSGNYN